MHSNFEAHPAVRGGQMQTLVAYLWPGTKAYPADESWVVALPDGDRVTLDINRSSRDDAPILYLLHGLGGSSESSYKQRIARKLVSMGYHVIRHNHRGCGTDGGLAKGIYHSGSYDDVFFCLRKVAERWPDNPIGTIGFSLSGVMVLNMLGLRRRELKELPQLKAAMSVCAPINLHESSAALGRWMNKHYDLFYSKTTIDHLLRRKVIDADFIQARLKNPSLRLVDEEVIAPLAGFLNAEDYYSRCSPCQIVGAIELPTYVLAASDDPIVPAKAVADAPYSRKVSLSLQRSGGHLGFIDRRLTHFRDYRWLDSLINAWANECLQKS